MNINKYFAIGLIDRDIPSLRAKFGFNQIERQNRFFLIKSFLSQFNNFLVILLIAAAIISLLVGEKLDSIFIFLVVLLNAFFGLFQEYKAEKSIALLSQMATTKVRVVRNGKEEEVDSRELLPSDIVYLEEGSKIPADCVVLESKNLEVNEASLTGESLPVFKREGDEKNSLLFMGTVVAQGRCFAKVISIGVDTKFGRVARTLSQIKEVKTPLQIKLEKLTKVIAIIGIGASTIVFGLSFISDKSAIESFIFAVSLAVAAVPEGLPAVMTIILSIGVEKMAKKGAIVRKLTAIETFGSLTLIATDKTGTLTTNRMRVKNIKTYGAASKSLIYLNSAVCSTASLVKKHDHNDYDVIGDTTEGSLLVFAKEKKVDYESLRQKWKLKSEIPFSPITKRMTVLVSDGRRDFVFSKGAPESILSICKFVQMGTKKVRLTTTRIADIKKSLDQYAMQGLRVIGFSYKSNSFKNLEKDQTFLGFVGITDPIRPEVFSAVSDAKKAGIRVVMITGDNELTAKMVGVETGIATRDDSVITGKELTELTDEELLKIIGEVKIFARTTPEDKYRLVKLYQSLGEVVAVTGDGVNDALALKQANVGVAMGLTGTDVAKDTAHIIITDDNFATLVHAIEMGRNIYKNIKNAIKYLLTCNVGEVVYIIFALLFKLPILAPLQLLYMNLITDGLPAISLAFSPHTREVLNEKPQKDLNILGKKDFKYIFGVGLLTVVMSIIPIFAEKALTVIFTTMMFIQHFILVHLYAPEKSVFKNFKIFTHPVFLIAFILPFILHPFLIYLPVLRDVFEVERINFSKLILISIYSAISLIIIKYLYRKEHVY